MSVAAGSVVTRTKVVSRTSRSEGSRNREVNRADFSSIRNVLRSKELGQRFEADYQSKEAELWLQQSMLYQAAAKPIRSAGVIALLWLIHVRSSFIGRVQTWGCATCPNRFT